MTMPVTHKAGKFILRMNFDYVSAAEVCKVLRKLSDSIDRTERLVGSRWVNHMSHSIFDRHATKVGAWQITE